MGGKRQSSNTPKTPSGIEIRDWASGKPPYELVFTTEECSAEKQQSETQRKRSKNPILSNYA